MVVATKNIWDKAQESPGNIWDRAADTNKAFDDLMTGVLEIQQFPGWPLTGIFDKDIAAKAGSALYYHYETGLLPEKTFDLVNEFNMLHFGQEVPAETGWKRIKQRYANGKAQVQSMDLGYQITLDLLKNPNAFEERLALLTQIEGKIKEDYWLESRGLIERMLGGTAQVTPFSLEALKAAPGPAVVGGVIGGLLAIGAGAISPLPEEVVTVPKAAALGIKVGATFGAADRVRQLEAGGQMLELMGMKDEYGNKIDPKVAVVASHLVGAINGAIEVAEWAILLQTFGVGTKIFENAAGKVTSKLLAEGTLKQIVAKYILKYGATLGAEVLQELEQETTNIVANALAIEINNQMKGTAFKPMTGADIKKRYAEVITESAYSFGLLVAPGTMISGTLEAIGRKGEAKPGAPAPVAPIVEKIAPKPPEAIKPEKVVSDEEYAAIKNRIAERQKPPGVAQVAVTPAEPTVPAPKTVETKDFLKPEERPTIYKADMEGMSKGSKPIKTSKLTSGENVQLKELAGSIYALIDGEEVGYAQVLDKNDFDVSVAKEYQKKGIGTLLMREFLGRNPEYRIGEGHFTEAGYKTFQKVVKIIPQGEIAPAKAISALDALQTLGKANQAEIDVADAMDSGRDPVEAYRQYFIDQGRLYGGDKKSKDSANRIVERIKKGQQASAKAEGEKQLIQSGDIVRLTVKHKQTALGIQAPYRLPEGQYRLRIEEKTSKKGTPTVSLHPIDKAGKPVKLTDAAGGTIDAIQLWKKTIKDLGPEFQLETRKAKQAPAGKAVEKPTRKTVQAVVDEIERNGVYQTALESQEIQGQQIKGGVYYVPKQFAGEVKAAKENYPVLKFHITHDPAKGMDWAKAVQEGFIDRTGGTAADIDIGEFLRLVAQSVKTGKKIGKLNANALDAMQGSGDLGSELLAAKYKMMRDGLSADEINENLVAIADEYGVIQTDIGDILVKESDYVGKKQKVVEGVEGEKGAVETEKAKRDKDLLGRPMLQGGAAGQQQIAWSPEDYKVLAERERINALADIEGQKQLPETGKLPGGRQAGGTILLSPQEWADAITAGYYHLQHGATVIADWSAKMIADFGEAIRPQLQALWDEIRRVKKVAEKPPEKAKRKKSKLTRRIEKRLKEELGGPGYEGMNMAKEAAKFTKEYEKNPEYMRRAGRGEVEPPAGLRIGTVYTGLKVIAIQEGDVDMLRDLAVVSTVTTASEFGQQVKAFDVPIENDPVRAMQEVAAVREKAVSKKMGVKDTKAAKTTIVKDIKAEMKKQAKVSKWEKFIMELQC